MDAKPVVFLDRDGVINEDSDAYIKSVAEVKFIPGSLAAIAKLSAAGIPVFIATNQSGVGRGLFSQQQLDEIHAYILQHIEQAGGKIEKIYYCPHHPDENCDCRKPKPGLLEQAKKEFQLAERKLFMVGDSLRDLEAGSAAGAKAILLKTGKGLRTLAKEIPVPHLVFENLAEAVDLLLLEGE